MASVLLSSITGGGGLPQLAPDLTYPGDRGSTGLLSIDVTGIDVSGGVLQEILAATGKFELKYLVITAVSLSEAVSLKLTIDGEVKWNDSYTIDATTRDELIGGVGGAQPTLLESYAVNESLSLEYATNADTNITLSYLLRPVL